jgi:hypothetical protein
MRIQKALFGLAAAAAVSAAGGASLAAASAPMEVTLAGGADGDASGSGTATVTVDPAALKVCYKVATTLKDATMAHIHKGAAGVSGPVVVPFANPTDGKTSGCAPVSKAVADELLAHPADYYVNVHTPKFPKGAIRGQL